MLKKRVCNRKISHISETMIQIVNEIIFIYDVHQPAMSEIIRKKMQIKIIVHVMISFFVSLYKKY